ARTWTRTGGRPVRAKAARRTGRAQLLGREGAIAVAVEGQQRPGGGGDLLGREQAITIAVESHHQRGRRRAEAPGTTRTQAARAPRATRATGAPASARAATATRATVAVARVDLPPVAANDIGKLPRSDMVVPPAATVLVDVEVVERIVLR